MQKIKHLFLGALTSEGFVSYFSGYLYSKYNLYLIKGAAGSGKSTIIKRVLARLAAAGCCATAVHCSSDPDSLDGVICPAEGFAIFDATAPHTLEPYELWGKHRVVSLYGYMNQDKLAPHSEQIIAYTKLNTQLLEKAESYIRAAGELMRQTFGYADAALEREKLERSAAALAKRLFPTTSREGELCEAFASAVTGQGLTHFYEENKKAAKHRVIFSDNGFAGASRAILTLARRARDAGYAVTLGRSPLCRDIVEYADIPELSLIIAANTPLTRCTDDGANVRGLYRFYDAAKMKETHNKQVFAKKCALALVDEACELMARAKKAHDALEHFYKSAVDFDAQRAESDRLISRLVPPARY